MLLSEAHDQLLVVIVGAVPPPPYVNSVTVLVLLNLNSLLLPANRTVIVPSVCTNSWTTPTSLAPRVPDAALILDHPFLAPMRPYWSMMQLVATKANPAAKSKGESCVFSPKKPGA